MEPERSDSRAKLKIKIKKYKNLRSMRPRLQAVALASLLNLAET